MRAIYGSREVPDSTVCYFSTTFRFLFAWFLLPGPKLSALQGLVWAETADHWEKVHVCVNV
ncbi:hypothetical protein JOB18_034445 [Solea senegalensis]|uniref:Uncharacterized protein n=1 Tax=Solea senegalensis TaxID=28829 RepID=A0AAV6RZL3_SOLSE|nr:hypothetical protein JOB18_034445 [Solea senegalensis]